MVEEEEVEEAMGVKHPLGYQQTLWTRLNVSHHFPEMATIHCNTNEGCRPTVGGWGPTTTMTVQGEFAILSTQSRNSSPSHIHWKGHTTHSPPRGLIMGVLMVVVVAVEEVVVVARGPAQKVKLHQWECAIGNAVRAVSAVDQQSPSIEATTTTTTSSTAQHLLQALDTGAQMTTWNGSCVSTTLTTTNLHPHPPPPFPPRLLP